jgi:hypothetical protein
LNNIRTITYRFILAVIFMLFICIDSSIKAENKIEIPFELVNGLTVIQAEIDGVRGSYLLDTGSDGIILDGEVARDSDRAIVSLGGSTPSNTQALNELKVGEFSQSNLEAQILSLQHIKDHLGIELKGIIGGYLFHPKVVIVDFKNSIITLEDKVDKSDKLKYQHKVHINTDYQIPIAKIQIEGKWYKFALDSGSSIHFVDPNILKELEDISTIDEATKMTCLANNTSAHVNKVRIKSFNFGGISFNDQICLPKSFEDINASTDIQLDGILSLSKLVRETVVIDYTRSKLYF